MKIYAKIYEMYIKTYYWACSCNHCCCANGISIKNYECVSVAVVILQVKRARHFVICGLSGATIFFHIIT